MKAVKATSTMGSTSMCARKICIKNFLRRAGTSTSSDPDAMKDQWRILEDCVQAIQQHRAVEHSLERIFKMVQQLCEQGRAPEMYDRILAKIRAHIRLRRDELLVETSKGPGPAILGQLHQVWSDFQQHINFVRSIFLYLDRTYILAHANVMPIWEASAAIFREEMIDRTTLQRRVIDELLALIAAERGGTQVDRSLLRALLQMLVSLQVYPQVFERRFLEETRRLYEVESAQLAQQMDVGNYVRHATRRLQEEEDRAQTYLDAQTKKALVQAVEEKLVGTELAEQLLTKGLARLLDDQAHEELGLLYALLGRTKEGHTVLRTHFSNYIKRVIKAVVLNKEQDAQMVDQLLNHKKRLDRVLQQCFGASEKLSQAQRDALDYAINARTNRPAELIAQYMDARLRGGNREATDEQFDALMDALIALFRFVQGKDVFEAYYKALLAKRLLLNRSASIDSEKAMIAKLRHECGPGFTLKLEGMFTDMALSKDMQEAFRIHSRKKAHEHGPEFSAVVLTMGHWPTYEQCQVRLPDFLSQSLTDFHDFYMERYGDKRRVLKWQHPLSQAFLTARFQNLTQQKELSVSLFQALVLLLFNEKDEMTMKEIQDTTEIPQVELVRVMLSLACGKQRLLAKTPKEGTRLTDETTFRWLDTINDARYRIKISQIQQKQTEEERTATEEQIGIDRQYQIDAAVVRTMKTRKALTHQQLLAELFAQLRFAATPADLKKRIESLIEREYLERDKNDTNVYKYMS